MVATYLPSPPLVWLSGWLLLFSGFVACSSGNDGPDLTTQSISYPVNFTDENVVIGAFVEVGVTIDPSAGLDFDDLDFEVDPIAGRISFSRGPDFDPAMPTIMLIAGGEVGTHDLWAFESATGQVVGRGTFEVTADWDDPEAGPGIVFEDARPHQELSGASVAEKLGLTPREAKGTHEVLIVFVDTASKRYTSSFDPNAWLEVFDSSRKPSVRRYIQEVSDQKLELDISMDPRILHVGGSFEQHHRRDSGGRWHTEESFHLVIAAALSSQGVDLEGFDTLVLVEQEQDPMWNPMEERFNQDGRFVWPHFKGRVTFPLSTGNRTIGTIFLPRGLIDAPTVYPVGMAIHEFGHAIGLKDLYRPKEGKTEHESNIVTYEPMGGHWGQRYQFSMMNKIVLGWVSDDQVEIIDSSGSDAEGVKLIRSSLATEPKDHRPSGDAALAFRIAPRLHYLWEHRGVPDEHGVSVITDLELSNPPLVYGTVVMPDEKSPLYELDPSKGDGARLRTPGVDSYTELDAGDADNLRSINVGLAGISAATADLFIEYGESSRPEPNIRPWQEAGRFAYRSEDVMVRNAQNWDGNQWTDEDAKWTALINAENRIIANVHNYGPVEAREAEIVFQYTEWGAGQDNWIDISSATVDIPANGTIEVESEPWYLRSSEGVDASSHYCIRVRIEPYAVPGTDPPVVEPNAKNNVAQSNVALVYSSTASPSSRVELPFRVENPFDEDRVFRIEVEQDNPLFRTYVGNQWIEVPAGDNRDVLIRTEYVDDGKDPALIDAFRDLPNHVNIRATTFEGDSFRSIGGVGLVARRGDRTEIVEVHADPIPESDEVRLSGQVLHLPSGAPAPDATVVVSLTGEDTDPVAHRVEMREGGFELLVPAAGWEQARALYLAPRGYARSRSGSVDNPN